MRINRDGTRLFITLNQAGKVVMFDISDPAKPKLLRVLDIGPASGPHYLRLTEDERRLVVSDYFLNEDSLGKVHAEGDHIVHVARVERHDLELDPRFQVNFNAAFRTGRRARTAWHSSSVPGPASTGAASHCMAPTFIA
jgi:selenium-binding protein 1